MTDALGRPMPAAAKKPLPKRMVTTGVFKPNWDSLAKNYRCPEWFQDAKFGIWAHWSPQCQPERGDWYAKWMYVQGEDHYSDHLKRFGHPSEQGFKDIDHAWRAERWEPKKLMALYKAAGAGYFVALANHHDNFDCYDSTYQEWNSVRVGPRKDIVSGWQKAAQEAGLRFGVSNHSSRTWYWLQTAYGYDVDGPKAGIRYDGWLTKADGKGKWWEGLDPQELYGGPSLAAPDGFKMKSEMQKWYADNGDGRNATRVPPDLYYVDKWFLRAQELVEKYHPDLVYLDDIELPLGQAGLDMAADFYNSNATFHNGRLEAVLTCKQLMGGHRPAVVEDYERGGAAGIQPLPWQTCSCIGNWHYDQGLFERHAYKPASQVVRMLVDIVSKNGNLLLSVPVKGEGTLDSDEIKFLKDMAAWMEVNQEAVFGTRPWKAYGEGPARATAGMFSEKAVRYGAKDIRFTAKDGVLYATVMAWPENGKVLVRSLASVEGKKQNGIQNVSLLGYAGKLVWKQDGDGLRVSLPTKRASEYTLSLKITGTDLEPAPFEEAPAPEHNWTLPKPIGIVYEAADASLSGGTWVARDHDGYLGKGFVAGYFGGSGQRTKFKVKAQAEGRRKAVIRYSNGFGTPQALSLYINGRFVKHLEFKGTADWDTWADLELDLDLKKGANTVALQKGEGDGCVNLDYLAVQ